MHPQYQTLVCPICVQEYDLDQHIPKIITACGHTICVYCLTQILKTSSSPKCPFDNKSFPHGKKTIDNHPVNFTVVNLIEEISTEQICIHHGEKKTIICLTDKIWICQDCALFGEHKGHEIQSAKQIKPKVDAKVSRLHSALDVIDKHYTEVERTTKHAKTSMEGIIKSEFERLQNLLKSKEKDCLEAVNRFFSLQEQNLHTLLGPASSVRQELKERISQHWNLFRDQGFTDLIEDGGIDSTIPKLDSEVLRLNVDALEVDIQKSTKSLVNNISQQGLDVPSIESSNSGSDKNILIILRKLSDPSDRIHEGCRGER